MNLSSGFVSGLNEIDFYVEGNGVTDGMALSPISFTASPTDVPEASGLWQAGVLLALGGIWRMRRSRPPV